jgi:hypothetical protein
MDYGKLIVAAVVGGLAGALGFLIGRVFKQSLQLSTHVQQAIVIGVVVGVSSSVSQCEPLTERVNLELGLKSALEVHMAKEGKRLLRDPRFQAATKDKDAYEHSVLAARLAGQGIALLDEPELDAWHRIRLRLAEQSQGVCAGLWKGSLSSENINAALSALPESEVLAWSRLSIDASLRALDDDATVVRDQQTLDEGLNEILSALPPMEQVRAREDMKQKNITDARACELMLLVLRGSQTLPLPLKYPFLRALSQV